MPKSSQKFIGVFDSGFGGIDVLRGIVKELPNYNYLYLGDTARTPYGTRSSEIIYDFTTQAVDYLFKNNCDLVILACNTASSEALRKIQREYLPKHYPDKKVLGVLIPAAEEAVLKTKNNRVGVIATEGTVKSGAFERELKKLSPNIKVFQNSCPLLVPIVEAGEQKSEVTTILLKQYLKPLVKKDIDALILGCTHYGILEEYIKKELGDKISIISESKVVPAKLGSYLERHHEIESKIGKSGEVRFCSTDMTDKFMLLGSKFYGKTIVAEKISLK